MAGEANLGTLRYLLAVPIDRTRLLVVKYAAIVVFAAVSTFFVAAVGAMLGLVLFGGGDVHHAVRLVAVRSATGCGGCCWSACT